MFMLICQTMLISSAAAENLSNTPGTHDLIQDSQGFIWTASHNGLTRYDSSNTLTFSSNNTNWPLPFNWINDIEIIDNNKILLATETHKLWLFNSITGQASPININLHRNSVYGASVFQGQYYLNVPDKLYKVDPKSLQTSIIDDNISISDLKHTQKYLYVTTKLGLYQLIDDRLELIIDDGINAIETTPDGLIVATDNELIVINDNGLQIKIPLDEHIQAIANENNENNENNIFTINKTGSIKKYSVTDLKQIAHHYPNSAPVYIRKMMHDTSGVLWLITSQGVKQLTQSATKNHEKIFDVTINAIELTVHHDNIIIGSYGAGLSAFNINNNNPILAPHINESFTKRAKIITQLISKGDNIYIATFDGLWLYKTLTNTVERIDFANNNYLIIDMTLKDNLLYLATNSNGLVVYDIASQQIIQHINGERLSSAEAINILPLSDGTVWIANPSGIDIYNHLTDSVTPLKSIGQNKVISLFEYKNKIFVATKGDGFLVYNHEGELLSHFAKNISFGYTSLINGEIWAPAQPGLYRIDPESYQVNMVPNTEIYTFTDSPVIYNNTIYVGHYGGILEVPLVNEAVFNPKVYISKTMVSGQLHLLNQSIKVQSSNDVITLEIASLDYRSGKEKQYKYQINNGLWNTTSGNSLTLTGLTSGLYNIEIMATNSLGQWSTNKAYTQINVAYPWYWTPQIRVLYVSAMLALLLTTVWLLYMRAKSISYIHHLLKSDLKSRGYTAQNVSRNIILAIEFINEHPDHNNQIFIKTKQVLQESIDELKQQEPSRLPDALYGKSLLMALPFLNEFLHKKYHVNLTNKIAIADDLLSHEMQADIYKIIYEALITAIVNGSGRNFKVAILEFKGKLWVTINDDSHSFTHFNNKINFDMAMYYIRQIAAKYNASVNTFSEKDKGSQLVISIPLMHLS